jgi:hypothetical protein
MHRGEIGVTPEDAAQPSMRGLIVGQDHEDAPSLGTPTLNAIIMSILCIAMQFELHCRMAAPGRTHVAADKFEKINL